MLLPRWLPVVFASTALFAACSSSGEKPGPPPSCPTCVSATTMGGQSTGSSGGGGSSGAGGDGQGGGDTAKVTGDVVTVSSVAFNSVAAYTKPATVYGDGLSHQQIAQPYDGASFTIDGVRTGDTWFLVAPTSPSDLFFPTYSLQAVPADKLFLPLLDQDVLTKIAIEAGVALSTAQAQIVLRVTHAKSPRKGISAQSAGAGLVLYDFGPGTYSVQDKVTGDRGVIVLLNQASSSITLTDAAAHVYHVDVRPESGTATLLDVEVL